ncbi:hypothetical protein JHN51_26005, partial [Streptomyces sp. MBT61]|nr:hypothetical protein [Streptomyces sp. MBT61]
ATGGVGGWLRLRTPFGSIALRRDPAGGRQQRDGEVGVGTEEAERLGGVGGWLRLRTPFGSIALRRDPAGGLGGPGGLSLSVGRG